MAKTLKKILLVLGIVALISSFVACNDVTESTPSTDSVTSESVLDESTSTGDESTSTGDESTSTGDESTSTGDESTSTGDESVECTHAFGDWTVLREATCVSGGKERRTCTLCGEKEDRNTEKTGHTYAVDYTCVDRTCTVEDCGYVQVATTGHDYGDWEVVEAPTCSLSGLDKRICNDCQAVETKTTYKDHTFAADGICEICHKNIKDLFIQNYNGSADPEVFEKTSITSDAIEGSYNITSSKEAGTPDAYAIIKGSILKALKELGYETLTVTVINPGRVGSCDSNDKCKTFLLAADNTANLWSADTAIEYWQWKQFWDIGGTITFELNIEEYLDTDLYIYTSQCGKYPTVIKVSEFVDIANPSTFFRSGTDNTTTYYEGKGWVFELKDGASGQYGYINANVVQSYIKKGCDFIKVSYKNDLGIEGLTNEGTPVNAEAALLPELAKGGNDWWGFNGVISQKAKYDATTDTYYTYIDLTSEAHNYEKDIELYFKSTDVHGKLVKYQYISSVEFIVHNEHDYVWAETVSPDCVNAGVKEGTCFACKETTTVDIPAGDHNLNAEGNCTGCGKNFTELLFSVQGADDVITYSPAKGLLSVTSTDTNSYVELNGNILKELKEIGYTKLTVNAKNTADRVNESSRMKSIYVAADSNDNLWSADTAIAWYNWKGFWDNGWNITFEIDLSVYAGRKIILFSDKCENYATEFYFAEFVDYTHPEAQLVASENGTIEYVDGKGWHVTSTDGEKDYYVNIPASVIGYNVANGNDTLRLSFVNSFGLDIDMTGKGTPVNITMAILPEKVGGGNDWQYSNTFISQRTYDEEKGCYYFDIDLTSADYDFTKDIELYFKFTDVATKPVGHTYISGIEYFKAQTEEPTPDPEPEVPTFPEASEDPYGGLFTESADSTVSYYEGYGWKITATAGSGAYNAYISGEVIAEYIAQGYTTLSLTYANDLGGNEFGNVGNVVNSQSPLVYKTADGKDAWVGGGFISGYTKDGNGGFIWSIDLTDATYDFTKGIRIYFNGQDGGDKDLPSTPNAFFSKIEFGGKEEVEPTPDPEPEVPTLPEASEDPYGGLFTESADSTVAYYEGYGWKVSAIAGSGASNAYISGAIISEYIANGYTTLTVKYINNFIGASGNDGNFVNSRGSVILFNAAGAGTWFNNTKFISGLTNEGNGVYSYTIDLTDTAWDFTKGIRLNFSGTDVASKNTPNAFLPAIEFGGKVEA